MKTWFTIRARATGAEVAIYDEIGAYGVSAKGFLAELGALSEGTPIYLRLNSPGGSVFDMGAYASIQIVARSPGLYAPSLFRHSKSMTTLWCKAFAQRTVISTASSAETP